MCCNTAGRLLPLMPIASETHRDAGELGRFGGDGGGAGLRCHARRARTHLQRMSIGRRLATRWNLMDAAAAAGWGSRAQAPGAPGLTPLLGSRSASGVAAALPAPTAASRSLQCTCWEGGPPAGAVEAPTTLFLSSRSLSMAEARVGGDQAAV